MRGEQISAAASHRARNNGSRGGEREGSLPSRAETCFVGSGGGSVYIWNNEPRSYLIGVEGPTGAEGPFRLTVSCNSR